MKKQISNISRGYSFSEELERMLEDRKFREMFELESAKVALIHRLAKLSGEPSLKRLKQFKSAGKLKPCLPELEAANEGDLSLENILKIARALGRDVTITFPKSHGQFKCKVA